MHIVTWNVNSIKARLPLVVEFIRQEQPEILLLQETKCENAKFPQEAFNELGYNVLVNGQKSYNGVAIASKFPMNGTKLSFENNPKEEHARFIEAEVNLPVGFARVISVYVINGGEVRSSAYEQKLSFLEHLGEYLRLQRRHDELLLVGGDFNVAPEEMDTANTKEEYTCFTMAERAAMRALLNKGMCDAYRICNPDVQGFTWWDYRERSLQNNRGMRLDMILASPNAMDKAKSCTVGKVWREKEKSSDHAPLSLRLSP